VTLWCEEPLTTKAMRGYLCAVVVLRGVMCRAEHCTASDDCSASRNRQLWES
jgi:hypothetical protein